MWKGERRREGELGEVAASLGGLVGKVGNVEKYFPLTVSHRVVVENAGLGWRGKNELVVNERHGCAIRFASISRLHPTYPKAWSDLLPHRIL